MINNRPLMNHVIKNGEFKSIAQMAKEFEVTPDLISYYYTNQKAISANMLIRIMRYLGIPIATVDELLAAEDDGVDAWQVKHPVFDKLIHDHGFKYDFDLAKALKVSPSTISDFRKKQTLSDAMILRVHEKFNMPVAEIRKLLGENHATP